MNDPWIISIAFISGVVSDYLTHVSIVSRVAGHRWKSAISVFIFTIVNFGTTLLVVLNESWISVIAFAVGRFISSIVVVNGKHIL